MSTMHDIADMPEPASPEAERMLLASLLAPTAGRAETMSAIDRLRDADFGEPEHRRIFNLCEMVQQDNQPVNPETVRMKAQLWQDDNYRMMVEGTLDKLASLQCGTPTDYINTVIRYGDARQQFVNMLPLMADLRMNPDSVGEVREQMVALTHNSRSTVTDSPTELTHYCEKNKEDLDKTEDERGIVRTNIYILDKKLGGGLKPKHVYVIGGRPGDGKSALAMNIMHAAAQQGRTSLMFNWEMDLKSLGERYMRLQPDYDSDEEDRGIMKQQMSSALARLERDGFNHLVHGIDCFGDGIQGSDVMSRVALFKQKHPLHLVVLDYTQLIKIKADNREQEVAAASWVALETSRLFDIPVMALSQLNRSKMGDKDGRPMPTLEHLRDSGAVGQDANVVMFVCPNTEQMHDSSRKIAEGHIMVAKQRSGELGPVDCNYIKSKCLWQQSSVATGFETINEVLPYE